MERKGKDIHYKAASHKTIIAFMWYTQLSLMGQFLQRFVTGQFIIQILCWTLHTGVYLTCTAFSNLTCESVVTVELFL
jgi:hypothetical protein